MKTAADIRALSECEAAFALAWIAHIAEQLGPDARHQLGLLRGAVLTLQASRGGKTVDALELLMRIKGDGSVKAFDDPRVVQRILEDMHRVRRSIALQGDEAAKPN